MTIKECIDIVDNVKPNQYSIDDKVQWLSYLDGTIINDVFKTHEGYDGSLDLFEGYSVDKMTVKLLVPSPYDRLYTQYLKMKIDEENGETARYNNSATMFNSYMLEYRKFYNRTHMPLSVCDRRPCLPNHSEYEITDAMYEKLKRELFEMLSKELSDPMHIDIIMNQVYDNLKDFKGADGFSPTIEVEEKENGAIISITDKNGIKQVVLEDGVGLGGKSAYAYAQDGGYTGTEEEFAQKLASTELPQVTEADNEKVLQVVGGAWAVTNVEMASELPSEEGVKF